MIPVTVDTNFGQC